MPGLPASPGHESSLGDAGAVTLVVEGAPAHGRHTAIHAQPAWYPAGGLPSTYKSPPYQSPHPIPGLRLLPPRVPPQSGQVVAGYEILEPEAGCCCCRCDDMHPAGKVAIVLLCLVGLPFLAWIPCCMPQFFKKCQAPVYGYPTSSSAAVHVPVGTPPPRF